MPGVLSVLRTSGWLASCALRAAGRLVALLGTAAGLSRGATKLAYGAPTYRSLDRSQQGAADLFLTRRKSQNLFLLPAGEIKSGRRLSSVFGSAAGVSYSYCTEAGRQCLRGLGFARATELRSRSHWRRASLSQTLPSRMTSGARSSSCQALLPLDSACLASGRTARTFRAWAYHSGAACGLTPAWR